MRFSSSLMALALLLAPAVASAGTIALKGSDTMVVLGQRWAEDYMKGHKDTTIQVHGGGSGTGISALINGTTDICEASRAMKDAEKKQVEEKSSKPVLETVVARDGLSVYVNDANGVNELTMAQLKSIFNVCDVNASPNLLMTYFGDLPVTTQIIEDDSDVPFCAP